MTINSRDIKITTRLPNDTYLRLRAAGFNRRESHQKIVKRAIEREVKRLEKGDPKQGGSEGKPVS